MLGMMINLLPQIAPPESSPHDYWWFDWVRSDTTTAIKTCSLFLPTSYRRLFYLFACDKISCCAQCCSREETSHTNFSHLIQSRVGDWTWTTHTYITLIRMIWFGVIKPDILYDCFNTVWFICILILQHDLTPDSMSYW